MRAVGLALAGSLAWLCLVALPAEAGSRYGARIEQLPEGVGCYWYRGQYFCNRYCYWEVDGYRYCQRRLEAATSQAPPLLLYDFEPRRYDRIRRGPVALDDAGPPQPPPRNGSQPIK
jgi:hypothetical protein